MAVPFNLATTPVEQTVRQVAAYLDAVTCCSAALALQIREPDQHIREVSLTLFHARSVPTIELETYMMRILKYCPCQNEVFIGLIVYIQTVIDRCARRRMPFVVDAYSIHRLVITIVTVASKWFSDVFFTNSRYAKVGGISVRELNTLELQFLSITDFDLNIAPEVLQAIGADLFTGRLPKLTNAPIPPIASNMTPSIHTHYPEIPTTATASGKQMFYAYPSARKTSSRPNGARPVSYPGPNGVFYSNPTNIYKYRNIDSEMLQQQQHQKHLQAVASRNMQSTGSTLTSSSPGDTTAISALNYGVY